MKLTRALALIACASVLAGAPSPAEAVSVYTNFVSSNSGSDFYTNDPFTSVSLPTTVVCCHPYTNDPRTQYHPNPVYGFASSQGASPLAGDGSGLAVHAQVSLLPGHVATQSQAIAAIEFEIVDPPPRSPHRSRSRSSATTPPAPAASSVPGCGRASGTSNRPAPSCSSRAPARSGSGARRRRS